jgi:hypothetical protein
MQNKAVKAKINVHRENLFIKAYLSNVVSFKHNASITGLVKLADFLEQKK